MESQKKALGQFFTRHTDVHRSMVSLVSHQTGRALEPSAGEGHLVRVLESERPGLLIDAVEIDAALTPVCETSVTFEDFFSWSRGRDGTYDVIFGNPPYVAWKSVTAETAASASEVKSRYSSKTNLYHLFIDRCVDLLAPGGELVFIVPKEWLYSTSAAPLRSKLAAEGAVTHLVDCGEEKLFQDASVPALLIFRFERGASSGVSYFETLANHLDDAPAPRVLRTEGSRWMLLPTDVGEVVEGWGHLGDAISVKVGLVTGLDKAFKLPATTKVARSCLQLQVTTKKSAELFINANHIRAEKDLPKSVLNHLSQYRDELLGRKIARFDESNWWHYGAIRNADAMASNTPRLYALAKTRSTEPFFTHPAKHFTGGVLGLFLKSDWEGVSPSEVAELLNSKLYRQIFEGLFLTSANKVSFQPATLEDVPFPRDPESFYQVLELVRTAQAPETPDLAA